MRLDVWVLVAGMYTLSGRDYNEVQVSCDQLMSVYLLQACSDVHIVREGLQWGASKLWSVDVSVLVAGM